MTNYSIDSDAQPKNRNTSQSSELPLQGSALKLTSPPPFDNPVGGKDLVGRLCSAISRHAVLSQASAVALAYWTLGTHLFRIFPIYPRLAVCSSIKRSGKTCVLRILHPMVHKPLKVEHISSAAVFRVIEAERPTLLIDEADTFLKGSEDLRGILNSGHQADGKVVRLVGENHEPRAFSTYAPVAIAAIGELPDTVADRSIVIEMKRRRPTDTFHRLDAAALDHLSMLGSMCVRWASDNMAKVRDRDPEIPLGLGDRAADNWRPLLAIAEVVGGSCADEARTVATALSTERCITESTGILLLADIRRLFSEKEIERIGSQKLAVSLWEMPWRPWANWKNLTGIGPGDIAGLLKQFEIVSQQLWIEGQNVHGYAATQFGDAFGRFL